LTDDEYMGAKQFFQLNIELVQKLCCIAVPFYEYKGERESLIKCANSRNRDGIEEYWKKKSDKLRW
jgi:hypothetical protein